MVDLPVGGGLHVVHRYRFHLEFTDRFRVPVGHHDRPRKLIGRRLRRDDYGRRVLKLFHDGRRHVVAMDIGDQYIVSLGKAVIASLRGVDIHHLPSGLERIAPFVRLSHG